MEVLNLDSKFFPVFEYSSFDNIPSAVSFHALSKSVFGGPSFLFGLVGAFRHK